MFACKGQSAFLDVVCLWSHAGFCFRVILSSAVFSLCNFVNLKLQFNENT